MIAVGWHPIFRASHHQAATDGIRKSPLPERRAHRGADADDCAASASIRASTASRTASSASSTGLRRIRVHQVFRPGLHEFELGCESPRLTCCGHVGSPRRSMSISLPALGVQKERPCPAPACTTRPPRPSQKPARREQADKCIVGTRGSDCKRKLLASSPRPLSAGDHAPHRPLITPILAGRPPS